MAPGHRRGLRTLLIPLLAVGWVCRGLLRGELFFERDQVLLFLPLKRYLAQRLSEGALPAWWPWDGLGQPMSALPVVSAFHPSTLGYFALPFEWAFNLQTLLPFPVALCGAWYLGRTLGLGRWGAALAAAAFTGGFYFVAIAEFTSMHLAAMSLPWVWREAIRVARSPRARGWVLALATANLLLGGDPMLLELAAMGTLVLVLGSGAKLRLRRVGRVALWAFLGVGLSAVQWVPMLHLLAESPRAAGLGVDVEDFWALRPVHLSGALLPGSFLPETFMFESTWVGGLGLSLAVCATFARWRWRWPLVGIVVMGLVLSAGRAAGLWQLFTAVVPGWSGFQFPAKVLSLVSLALSLLVGRGAWVAARQPARLAPALGLGGLVSLGLGAVGPGIVLIVAGGVLLLAALPHTAAKVRPALGLLLTLIVSGDQLMHGAAIETRPWSELKESPLVAALRAQGIGLDGQSYQQAWPLPPFSERLEGMRLQVASLRPTVGSLWGLPSAGPYLQSFTRRVYDVTIADKEAWLSRRATLFGVGAYVVSGSALRQNQQSRVKYFDPSLDLAVVAAARSMPPAYVAFSLHRVEEARTVEALSAPGFVFGRDLLVPADGPYAVPESFEQQAEQPVQPVAVHHHGDGASLEFSLERPGVMVLNEAFTQATTVTDDGVELDCFPVNHAVLGVALPPGLHHIEVLRHIAGLRDGVALSMLSASCLLLAIWRRRAGRINADTGRRTA